ncbi:uncharacterized protein BDZ99DRAFT_398990 [Mytilinidion resinicola]|uniref:Uncharacterized protein n=1 Tax=Mytilinidion resinicola TaxID=574789 RepID=A0A6A6Y5I2_9PEZI|nr:uncharacterized protein BDZ99DRAFT_398990 [Mytilinidion resinicola]KAF2803783.1 hypothetical protein BDZ99DRAFT_398990 [Mytilinidion resinicola]
MTRTPPQLSIPTFQPPPSQRNPSASPEIGRGGSPAAYNRATSPALSIQSAQRHAMPFPSGSPDPNRAPSPAFSDIRSARSGSPTLVRPNSAATNRSPISPSSPVPMRSMFPVYDPTVPLGRQAYAPTQTSPTHIPVNRIHRSPYSPELYIPHGNVNNGDQESSDAPTFTCAPYFTPSALLENLWVATNGQEEPAVQIYTLKMHRATAATPQVTFGPTASLPFYSLTQSDLEGKDPLELATMTHEVLIQRHHPTQPRALPVNHLDLVVPPSSATANSFDDSPSTLLATIYPKLAALAALDAAANSPAASHIAFADPGATSHAAQRLAEDVLRGAAERECSALTWTREAPTQQTNPWAHALNPTGSYQLHHPTLGLFPIQLEGDCAGINSPSTRPQTAVYGHPSFAQAQARSRAGSITLLNPYVLSPTSPRAFNPPPPSTPLRSVSAAGTARPGSMFSDVDAAHLATANDAAADDAVLARLDFGTDSLLLNVAALTRFGNPYLVDVAATALLSVAVAEAARNPKSRTSSAQEVPTMFEAPPPSTALGPKPKSSAASFKESFVEGFESWGGAKSISKGKKWSRSLRSSATTSKSQSLDKDIELGQWYGQQDEAQAKTKTKGKKSKAEKKESTLPFVARTLIGVLTFAFKAFVWVVGLVFKIIAGLVVMLTRNASKL